MTLCHILPERRGWLIVSSSLDTECRKPFEPILSRLYLPLFLAGHQDGIQCPYKADWYRSFLADLYWYHHGNEPQRDFADEFISSTWAVPLCFVSLAWIIEVMGDKCPYSYCFVGCGAVTRICFEQHVESLYITRLFFSSNRFFKLQVVQPCNSIHTTTACFILSERLDFFRVDNCGGRRLHTFSRSIRTKVSELGFERTLQRHLLLCHWDSSYLDLIRPCKKKKKEKSIQNCKYECKMSAIP